MKEEKKDEIIKNDGIKGKLVGKLADKELQSVKFIYNSIQTNKGRLLAATTDEIELGGLAALSMNEIIKEIGEAEFNRILNLYKNGEDLTGIEITLRKKFGSFLYVATQYAGVNGIKMTAFGTIQKYEKIRKEFIEKMFRRYKLDKHFEYTIDFEKSGYIYQRTDRPQIKANEDVVAKKEIEDKVVDSKDSPLDK